MAIHPMNYREQPAGLQGKSACGKKRASPSPSPSPPLPTVPEAPVFPDPIRFEDGSIGFRERDHFTALNFLWGCADCATKLALAHVPCGFVFDTVTKYGDDFDGIYAAIMLQYGTILDRVEAIYNMQPFTIQHAEDLYKGFFHNGTRSRVKSLEDTLAEHNVSVSHNTLVELALKNFDGHSLLSWKPTVRIPSFSHFCTEMSVVKLTIPDNELKALETLRATVQSK